MQRENMRCPAKALCPAGPAGATGGEGENMQADAQGSTKKKRAVVVIASALLALLLALLYIFPRPTGSWPAIFSALGLWPREAPACPTVTFVDVGQGDCTLLRNGEHTVLIDTGTDGYSLLRTLRREGVGQIDELIATHPHADHIGGMDLIMEAFAVGRLYVSDMPPADETDAQCYGRMLEAAAAQKVEISHPKDGGILDIGGIHLEFFAPLPAAPDENERSLFVRAQLGGASVLVTGDAGVDAETALLSRQENMEAAILKVGHHGSSNSSSPAFLRAVAPDYAVISVGVDNAYGHPDAGTLTRLQNAGAAVLRTDVLGAIRFSVLEDGSVQRTVRE